MAPPVLGGPVCLRRGSLIPRPADLNYPSGDAQRKEAGVTRTVDRKTSACSYLKISRESSALGCDAGSSRAKIGSRPRSVQICVTDTPHRTPLCLRARGCLTGWISTHGAGPRAPQNPQAPPLAELELMARPRLELGTPRFSAVHVAGHNAARHRRSGR